MVYFLDETSLKGPHGLCCLLEVMLMSVICVANRGHAMLMFTVCAAARGHVIIQDPCCPQKPWRFLSLFCCRKPSWYLWFVLPLEAVLLSAVCVATRNHVDVFDPCCQQLPWARKLLLQWYHWLQTHNWEWEILKASVIPPPPQNETVETGSYWRESLKITIKMLKYSSLQLMAYGGRRRRIQFSVRSWPPGVWPCSSEYTVNTNWTCWWCCFWRGWAQGFKGRPGRNGSKCDLGALYKIPK